MYVYYCCMTIETFYVFGADKSKFLVVYKMTMVVKKSLTANVVTNIMMFPWQNEKNLYLSIFGA